MPRCSSMRKSGEVVEELGAGNGGRARRAARDFEEAAQLRDQVAHAQAHPGAALRAGRERRSGRAGLPHQPPASPASRCFTSATASTWRTRVISFRSWGYAHSIPDILTSFIAQYPLDRPAPHELIVSHPLEDAALLAEVLSNQESPCGRNRGQRARRARAFSRTGAEECRCGAGDAPGEQPDDARTFRGAARRPRPRRNAAAPRMLRHQSYDGRGDSCLVRGVRPGGSREDRSIGASTSPASSSATTTRRCTRHSSAATSASRRARAPCPMSC